MKTLDRTYHIEAAPEIVWQALTDPAWIEGWGGGPAVMNSLVGTKFSLWGGEIWGTNTDIIVNRKIGQDWYDAELPEPTLLTLTLDRDGHATNVVLHQENIPDDRADAIGEGWDTYYMGPLKEYVENLETV